jgi:hypothetical protein
MRNRHIAIALLIILIVCAGLACSKAPRTQTIEGTLDSWSFDPPSVTVNGIEYGLAEGLAQYLEDAEAGKMYKIVVDEHGNVIAVKPL